MKRALGRAESHDVSQPHEVVIVNQEIGFSHKYMHASKKKLNGGLVKKLGFAFWRCSSSSSEEGILNRGLDPHGDPEEAAVFSVPKLQNLRGPGMIVSSPVRWWHWDGERVRDAGSSRVPAITERRLHQTPATTNKRSRHLRIMPSAIQKAQKRYPSSL